MKISALKNFLADKQELAITLPDGTLVPSHFHVTEVGETTKHFIDCGGTVRLEKVATLQLWSTIDYDHRLLGQKFHNIIVLAERNLGLGDLEVQVEYQGQNTIEQYGLEVVGDGLALVGQLTNCLAMDKCGIPAEKPKVSIKNLAVGASSCAPGSGCC